MKDTEGTPAQPALTPEQRSTEFVPTQGGTESTSAETLLVAAYLLMWAALIGFIFLTWRRQNRLDERLVTLEANVKRALPKG